MNSQAGVMGEVPFLVDVQRKVEAARAAKQRAVEAIAADVRERLVRPACAEHGMGFKSGNGTYFFHCAREGEKVYLGDADDPRAPLSVRRALAVLDVEVGDGHMLGFYVRDVDPQALPGRVRP